MNNKPIRAAAAAVCLVVLVAAGCDRDATHVERSEPTVGQKLDRALDRTQERLADAGEKTQQKLAEAGDRIQPKLAEAGDRIGDAGSRAVAEVRETVRGDGPEGRDPNATTTTITTGPSTSVTVPGETRARIADAAITASIKADYLKDPDLSVLKIDVDTHDGVVTLNGLAENEAARKRAEQLAGAIKGVREVRNHLTVKRA